MIIMTLHVMHWQHAPSRWQLASNRVRRCNGTSLQLQFATVAMRHLWSCDSRRADKMSCTSSARSLSRSTGAGPLEFSDDVSTTTWSP